MNISKPCIPVGALRDPGDTQNHKSLLLPKKAAEERALLGNVRYKQTSKTATMPNGFEVQAHSQLIAPCWRP